MRATLFAVCVGVFFVCLAPDVIVSTALCIPVNISRALFHSNRDPRHSSLRSQDAFHRLRLGENGEAWEEVTFSCDACAYESLLGHCE